MDRLGALRSLMSALALVLVLRFLGACGGNPPPQPPEPPKEVHISVWGNGSLVADRVTFATLQPESPVCNQVLDVVHYDDPAGPRLRAVLPACAVYGDGASLILDAPGYQRFMLTRVILAPDINVALVPIPVEPPALPRLRGRGQFVEQSDGTWFTVKDTTDFSLYAKFKEGINIDHILEQRMDTGFNTVRIFGVTQNTWPTYHANLTPQRYGDSYYQDIPAFFRKLSHYRLYGNWVAFISNNEVPESRQLEHWARLTSVLAGIPNVILSAMNEHNVHPLATLFRLPRPIGVFSSHGSNGGTPDGNNGAAPPEPYWDWTELHTNDTPEWVRKAGHNCMELSNVIPCIASENTRAPDRFNSEAQAFDAAAGTTLLAGGYTFHSFGGRASDLWTDTELRLARASIAGSNSVPVHCQAGQYYHRLNDEIAEENAGGYLRVYQRGDDRANCRVRQRR